MVLVFITLLFIFLLNSNIAIQISLSFVQYFKNFRCVDAEIFRGGGRGPRDIFCRTFCVMTSIEIELILENMKTDIMNCFNQIFNDCISRIIILTEIIVLIHSANFSNLYKIRIIILVLSFI